MPVNLSLNSSSAEHHGSKCGSSYPTGHSRGADGKGGDGLPLVKTESEMPEGVSCSGAAYQEERQEPMRMVYGQSHCDFPLTGFMKNEPRNTPDSTNDSAAREVGDLGVCHRGFPPPSRSPFQHCLFLYRYITWAPPQELVIPSTVPQCKDNAPSSYDVLSVMHLQMWPEMVCNIHCDLCWTPEPEMFCSIRTLYELLVFPALDLMWSGKNVSSEERILEVHQYLTPSSLGAFAILLKSIQHLFG